MKIISLTLLILTIAAPIYAASRDDILGLWDNQEKDAKIEVFKCADKYCGKIVSLKNPNYLPGSTEGTPGTPRVDRNNPNPSLKTQPIIGLQIMNNFIFKGGNEWKGGTVYDPKKGKTYQGKITLVSPHQLDLRGFIGVSLIGRTSTWTR